VSVRDPRNARGFRKDTKTSSYTAAIFCLEEAAILFENPAAATPLTNAKRAALTRLPWFDIGHSISNWRPDDLDRAHALATSMIEALHKDRAAS
jgi:hypothetical protein